MNAVNLLAGLAQTQTATILPWQVAGELLNWLRKWQLAGRVSNADVEAHFRDFLTMFPLVIPNAHVFQRYFDLHARFSLSHWDSRPSSLNSGNRWRQMMKRKQHRNVQEMVRKVSDGENFADDFDRRISERRLIKALTVLRARAGLSQKDLATKLGCTQSKISKLERSNDKNIAFGDFLAYASSVNHDLRVFLVQKGQPLADEINMERGKMTG